MINLTAALTKAAKDLREMRMWNGMYVEDAICPSEEQKRSDAKSDGLTHEATESYINDYACFYLHLEPPESPEDCEYVIHDFDDSKAEKDFREWMKQYVEDESLMPDKIELRGFDNEFMKPGYGE